MFIDKKLWDELVDKFNVLYHGYDTFSDDYQTIIDDIDICIDAIKNHNSNKIYVITNNAVVDHEIDYCIYDVTTNKDEAKKIFECAVHDAKTDADFDDLNAVNVNDDSNIDYDEEWVYSETENFLNFI